MSLATINTALGEVTGETTASLAENLSSLVTDIANTYDVIATKQGIVPLYKNAENLADSIGSIYE